MAKISELLEQVEDKALRARLQEEFDRVSKTKKFGLVFEDHIPECTPLYGIGIKIGSNVAKKAGQIKEVYSVVSIDGTMAKCYHKPTKETVEIPLEELVPVAQFGEPIFPMLQPIDSIQNAPDSSLWHTLIEADNYHALQLLEYLYAGKVDCIYIDPPYNTRAKDWKYNNDYVDPTDAYKHSKWLSMMRKRLLIAKRLLNHDDSVMLVTIDEKEYIHLGCLLEEVFPEARIQMVSTVINPKGVSSLSGFKRADEYIYIVMIGTSSPDALPLSNEWSPSAIRSGAATVTTTVRVEPGWTSMMRRGSHSSRAERPGLYYAIFADPETRTINRIGDVLPPDKVRDDDVDGLVQILPFRTNGDQGCWQVGPEELKNRIDQGRVRLGRETSYGFVVNYLPDGEYSKVTTGFYTVEGRANDGSLIAYRVEEMQEKWVAPTQWKIASHDASAYGSSLLTAIIGEKRFEFPKSLYAEHDVIRFFTATKPDALIVDFFAGSGTTLHAVNLLNAEDSGSRRCIMVTNNEVSADEADDLTSRGFFPGDSEWEKYGIARYVTWPRTVNSILGKDIKGNPLSGNYGVEVERFIKDETGRGKYVKKKMPLYPDMSDMKMSDGFAANVEYFKLGFLDRDRVSLGQQFKEILPLLWLKAGAIGERPEVEEAEPDMLILPKNGFAVLVDETMYAAFLRQVKQNHEIKMIFFVTDSEEAFREMSAGVTGCETFQLYRDYIDNFVLGSRRA